MMPQKAVPLALAVVPIAIWSLHVVYLVPLLGTLDGDAKLITAMRFFAVAAVVMTSCELLALVCWWQSRDRTSFLPIVLNWTWLYYVKVLLWGPTVGDL
jgi:hypothetical protein